MKFATLAVIVRNGRLLLGYKKRGFAVGVLNGPGGKVEDNESSVECVIRETKEEMGIQLKDPQLMGVVEFFSDSVRDWVVFVFSANDFDGSVVESDEVKPKWVDVDEIPYDEMWSDDRFWLPYILKGKRIHAVFYYENDKLVRHSINELC